MLSREMARSLRDAGLVWHPEPGDAFQLLDAEPEPAAGEVFVVSEMTIEAHHYPSGTVLGFNGTTEWALDSVDLERALWIPREDQLRQALKSTFVRLERESATSWSVATVFLGEARRFEAQDAETAYALAVLDELAASA